MKKAENKGKKKGLKMILKILLGLLGAIVICLLAIYLEPDYAGEGKNNIRESPRRDG